MGWSSMLEDLWNDMGMLQRSMSSEKAKNLHRKIAIKLEKMEDILELATDPDFDLAARFSDLESTNYLLVSKLERIENTWHRCRKNPTEQNLRRLKMCLDSQFGNRRLLETRR